MRHRTRNPKPIEQARRYTRSRFERVIVVSFTSDPYQPREITERKTRRVLEILRPTRHTVMVLTKSTLAERDFDLLEGPNMWLGYTITALGRIPDEPHSSGNDARIEVLRRAHERGINTYCSIEPTLPGVTDVPEIIRKTYDFVDYYIIGRLDYETRFGYPKIPEGYYKPMLREVLPLLMTFKKMFHFKKQLLNNP